MDNFCCAAHHPGMKLAARSPPVRREQERERGGGEKRESDGDAIESPAGTVPIFKPGIICCIAELQAEGLPGPQRTPRFTVAISL